MTGTVSLDYPVQLGIAYLFLAGYLMRTLFVSLGLPAAVGVIFSGFAFSRFFQSDVLAARDILQQLAFFLVLLTAGLEIRLRDLRPYFFLMAFFPATCEIVAIATYGHMALNFTRIESLVLAVVLVSIGDGLVIPKMKEFGLVFKGHPMPRLVFCWAPLEASFVLTLFGILVGLAEPANAPSIDIRLVVLANILRIIATVAAGALLGGVSGWLVPRRTELTLRGRQIFTGASVEGFLMVVAVALIAFGLGSAEKGKVLIPVGFSFGSLFQPELLVIVTGTSFAAVANDKVLHEVEGVLGGVWIFGQLVLFSMLGSRTSLGIFPQIPHVLPIMAVGLTARFVGVVLSVGTTLQLNLSGHPFQRAMFIQDVLFCFLSTIPRATIQGALGSVPIVQGFFQHSQNRHHVELFIFTAARLYIFCTSICGMLLLNHFGAKICTATSERPPWGSSDSHQKVQPLDDTPPLPVKSRSKEVIAAMAILAKEYDVDPETVMGAVRRGLAHEHEPSNSEADEADDDFQFPARRAYSVNRGLTLTQFECTGTLLNDVRQLNKATSPSSADGRSRIPSGASVPSRASPSSLDESSHIPPDLSKQLNTNKFGWL